MPWTVRRQQLDSSLVRRPESPDEDRGVRVAAVESAKASSSMVRGRKIFPVVDLFAGPGGLGEGFSSAQGDDGAARFRCAISIERDAGSHSTLLLRHFYKSFGEEQVPDDYYDFLSGRITLDELFRRFPENHRHASLSAQRISLGSESRDLVRGLISRQIGGESRWVLIGGPPCQAYSLVGRSRMKGRPDFEEDERHTLYLEYLRIVADHRPPIFVMENVKGLLSAKVNGQSMIRRIVKDLECPSSAIRGAPRDLRYKLYSLAEDGVAEGDVDPRQFLVRAERFGIPQARHRMFMVGIRSDIKVKPATLKPMAPPTVRETIDSLPKIRSEISSDHDSLESWLSEIRKIARVSMRRHLSGVPSAQSIIQDLTIDGLAARRFPEASLSRRYPSRVPSHQILRRIHDPRLSVLTSHESRSHMASDLRRYYFAAVFARYAGRSPSLADFPEELLPEHKNVKAGQSGKMFADRFRVQIADQVSTTITSHISKDGHYFIHYDPSQCRSLTVREAARLQTFPDNYFFCGPRTSQYHQVGNAVPPQLARQIAEIVGEVLDRMPGSR